MGVFSVTGAAPCWPREQEDSEMTTPRDVYRDAANSQAGRDAAAAARDAAATARSVKDDVGEFAANVSDKAGEHLGRAQDMAVDAYDEVYHYARRNPLAAIGIALGVGFLFGALTTARR
jgi:ElaB/YqjD/DUF883 family membrane-anchored ribosome-binding protein